MGPSMTMRRRCGRRSVARGRRSGGAGDRVDREMHVLWSGALESEEFKRLVDSPLRGTIRTKLLAGESAVWVLVEGGISSVTMRHSGNCKRS